jgi:hypothetical protein
LGSCKKIQKLKAKVQNKARVEGCIVEAQLVEEATISSLSFLGPKIGQLETRFLAMMMVLLPSKVHVTLDFFKSLAIT